MSKKLIISLSVILCAIVVVLILFWTLFGLSSVTVEFSSTLVNLAVSEEEIINAGNFSYGSSVLFEGKTKYIENINNYASENENFAYIRVTNIETIFPNKFVVYVTEREELFAVEVDVNEGASADKQYLICDREFRVLKILDEFTSTQDNAILLKGLKFDNEDVKVGDFLNVEQSAMLNFYSVMVANNRDLSEQWGKFKELELGVCTNELTGIEYVSLTLTTFQGQVFEIDNIDFAFANKVQLMFAVESAMFNQNVDANGNLLNSDGEIIYVLKTESGEYVSSEENVEGSVPLSYDLLSNCYIRVDNLTLDENVDRTENDIYYAFVSKEQ